MKPYDSGKKFILILSQRDICHPGAGGAEKYIYNVAKYLANEIPVVNIGVYHPNIPLREEYIDGVYYIRLGKNLFSLIIEAIRFYFRYRKNIIAVIDHVNTHQFFTFLWARKKRIFFIHQLTLEIWSYQFGKIIGTICRLLEEILLRFSRGPTITVVDSTARDLSNRGFKNILITVQGGYVKNQELPSMETKGDYLIYVGRLMAYKRVEDAIYLAHELHRKLYIIGKGPEKYLTKLKRLVLELNVDCEFKGFLPAEERDILVRDAYLSIMPSIREGWGLVVVEASNMGTPALVYPVNGTIESTDYGRAGFVAKEVSWKSMLEAIKSITPEKYIEIRKQAFEFSKKYDYKNTAVEFRDRLIQHLHARGVGFEEIKNFNENVGKKDSYKIIK